MTCVFVLLAILSRRALNLHRLCLALMLSAVSDVAKINVSAVSLAAVLWVCLRFPLHEGTSAPLAEVAALRSKCK